MIDFGDFIKSQRGNVGFPRRKKNRNIPISEITQSGSIEEAKAKVQAIIDSGAATRKRNKRLRDEQQSKKHSYIV